MHAEFRKNPITFVAITILSLFSLVSAPCLADRADADAYLNGLPQWEASVDSFTQAQPSYVMMKDDVGNDVPFKFDWESGEIKEQEFFNVPAEDASATTLWPGAILSINSIREGQPSILRLKRDGAPITISIDANVDDKSREVPDPSSVTVPQAVASLIRSADAIDLPARVNYQMKEAHSLEQSLFTADLTGKAPEVGNISGAFEAGFDVETKSVVAVLRQKLFVVSVNEDLIAQPAELLSTSVGSAELKAAGASGANVPVFVTSVTYGRMLVFILRSKEVASTAELKAAIQGAYDGFEGGGGTSAKHKAVFQEAEKFVAPYGGSQEDAFAAVGSADFSKFFSPMKATEALPLSYTVMQLRHDRKPLAVFVQSATYFDVTGVIPPRGIEVTAKVNSLEPNDGACRTMYTFESQLRTEKMLDYDKIFRTTQSLKAKQNFNQSAARRDVEAPTSGNPTLTVRSFVQATGTGAANQKTSTFTYPFKNITKNYKLTQNVPGAIAAANCPTRFTLTMNKSFLY